jgi:hypothetical protein
MVPHSMNGADLDRGSHEFFAIRLPDAMYLERRRNVSRAKELAIGSVDAQNPQCRR